MIPFILAGIAGLSGVGLIVRALLDIDDPREWPMFTGLGLILCSLIFAGGLAIYQDNENKERLIAQCRADGHKEYECAAMFRDNNTSSNTLIMVHQ